MQYQNVQDTLTFGRHSAPDTASRYTDEPGSPGVVVALALMAFGGVSVSLVWLVAILVFR